MNIDYGIDAPGVRRGMAAVGAAGVAVACGGALAGSGIAIAAGLLAAGYGGFMAGYMTHGSRVGKLRTRARLLDAVHALRPWRGDEQVLDVGCGRGLMAIGAAHRLARGGQAVGIDLWREQDQSGNGAPAALANAAAEGVADRVRIDTGDMRALPYADASFDVVLSHWAVHNLDDAAERTRALNEMLRVLRPGGVLALADIAHVPAYAAHLRSRGVPQVQLHDGGLEARVMGVLSGGSFRPQAVMVRR